MCFLFVFGGVLDSCFEMLYEDGFQKYSRNTYSCIKMTIVYYIKGFGMGKKI